MVGQNSSIILSYTLIAGRWGRTSNKEGSLMDWTMIIVFTVMSIVFGVFFWFFDKSFICGLFFTLIGMGLTLTAAISLTTGYDGIFVWINYSWPILHYPAN